MAGRQKTVWRGGTQLAPVPAVLVGCGDQRKWKYNLITVAWCGTVASDPPQLSISVRKERYSFAPIAELGEFTVNLPDVPMTAALDNCGVISGRDADKFALHQLTAVRGSRVAAPIVGEAPLSLECKVVTSLDLGSHTMFVGEILAVQVSSELLDADGRFDVARANLVAFAHGHYFELGRCLGGFGFSVRKKR
ncbi:MAG: flavin reductase family protein [Lentisphaeria bacterium]|nr:flavin reductase family protein [Lentisphaeria bacterium]